MKRYLILLLLLVSVTVYSKPVKIKFASLAPRGTTWLNVMDEYNKAVKDATGKQVSFRIYPGGVSGNEIDVLRKIRIGQLHSGGFTGVALGEILSEVRVFDAPFLFRNYEEVDHIHNHLFEKFAAKFEENGFILLGWAEVGFVYIFTKKPVHSLKDLEGIKMWMWEGDQVAKATFDALKFKPIPLSVTDVLTALQTGMIDGFYVSPMGAIALQWHSKVKYMLKLPLANAIGAIVISKKKWDEIPDEYKSVVKDMGHSYMEKLVKLSREDNEKTIDEFVKSGIQITEITDPAVLKRIDEAGKAARKTMSQTLFPAELMLEVEQELEKLRNDNTKSN